MGWQSRDVAGVRGARGGNPRLDAPDPDSTATRSGAPVECSAEELACRARDGCSDCFAVLVERFAGRLYGYLRQRGAARHDAEDLVQETFLRALTKLERYQPERRFSTWLFTIATRLAVSRHRARRRAVDLSGVDRADDRAEDPHESAWRRERNGSLWSLAAERLSRTQLAALWLHYAEDLPVEDIAAAMGRTRVGVRVLLHRARRRLGAALAHLPHDERMSTNGS